MIFLDYLVNAG